jgi:tight adherence protein B
MSLQLINILISSLAILLAIGLAVFGLIRALVAYSDVNERLETYASINQEIRVQDTSRNKGTLVRFRLKINSALSILASEELGMKLLSANWPITETEYILIQIWGIVLGFLLGWFGFQSIISGIGFAVLAYLIPGIMLTRAISKRRMLFSRQLIDVLVLITGAVRAGYSFLQAIDVVVEEMNAPASEEFRRVRREVGLGLPMSHALDNLNTRMQNDDLHLVITAVNINSQVGGNLTTMLEAVTNTIRERIQLFSEIRAVTSQQRFSSYLLTLLPFIVAGVLFIINPEYISRLFEPGPILCVPIGALILVLLGNLAIRLVSKIDV